MTIKKRLLLSNLGMLLIPAVLYLTFEMVIGYLMLHAMQREVGQDTVDRFRSFRPYMIVAAVVLANVLLTYLVSKSIIRRLNQLRQGIQEVSGGNLDYPIAMDGANDEIGELAQAFERMRSELKHSQEIQRRYELNQKELVAGISHDLKTPLTSIKGYVRGISDGVANTPEKLERYLKTIESKADDMDDLISELLLYSKLDLPNVPYQLQRLDLSSYLETYTAELAADLTPAGIRVRLDFDRKKNQPFIVLADLEKLKRVLSNIVQNSVKHMDKDHKTLEFRLLPMEDRVGVEIRDNGPGVAQHDLPHLFDRFYRADVSRNSATGGSGLGLAIVKKIIEGHGGTVWADSTHGEGLSIGFSLMRAEEGRESNGQPDSHH